MSKEKKHSGTIEVVIETPKGCRNKYTYDKKVKAFRLKKLLPAGSVFPFDFGFIPGTKGQDGDPLDILVIMEEPAYPGIVLTCNIIGVLKARQSEDGKMIRNDRLIGVSAVTHMYAHMKTIADLNKNTMDEIAQFFLSYNKLEGREFQPEGWAGIDEALKLIEEAE